MRPSAASAVPLLVTLAVGAAAPALAGPPAPSGLPEVIALGEVIAVRDHRPHAEHPVPLLRLGADGAGLVIAVPPGSRLARVPDGDPARDGASEDPELGELVRWQGRVGRLSDAYAITADDVLPTPAPGVRLVRGALAWGDVPHVDWFLVDARGRWLPLDDDGPEATAALSPDGRTLVLGLRALTFVDLRAWSARVVDGFTAPAYAPDGTLYVRGGWQYVYPADGPGDAVFALDAKGRATPVLAHPGTPPDSEPGMDAGIPAPVTFEDGGKTLVATFARGLEGPPVTVRAPPVR